MRKEKEIKSSLVNFQIRGVEVINNSFVLPPSPPIGNNINFNFNIKIENKVDHVNKLILVIVHVDISTFETPLNILGNISVACIFNVENYDEIITPEKDNVNVTLPDELSTLLNSISISTTRGVMAQIYKGTFLNAAILPIVDPKVFKKL